MRGFGLVHTGGTVPLFGRSRKKGPDQAQQQPLVEEVNSREFSLKLSYGAKCSESVRLKGGSGMDERLGNMLFGYVQGESEHVEPLPVELGGATPSIARVPGSAQWLKYHHDRSPVRCTPSSSWNWSRRSIPSMRRSSSVCSTVRSTRLVSPTTTRSWAVSPRTGTRSP